MIRNRTNFLAACAAAGVAIAALVAYPAVATSQAQPRWEYKVVTLYDVTDHEPTLNKLGREGWELVSDYASRFVLRRPR